jgi:hypothetical protein
MTNIEEESVPVRCERCQRKLLFVYCRDPNVDVHVKISAKCPYCVGESAVHQFDGVIYISNVSADSSSSPNKIVDIVCVGDQSYQYILGKA